ncbi:DUF1559 family PulG-like putative transporter [Tuwongella immobilis]|uniref:DUF1559 domain-containing protein n=1 Tax=Tuwongella immobilis TaxID=692036 RepID=A0A6C2YMR5_9BACT|nr:DUF1559 domain-containing protein [Tuwongella immobilis]VIP02664.1 Protein containing DUF1559 OS=Rhodopirellula baltica SH28 GN=RBSH_02541 PE=4 SV=1: SBP_bac_10 [Tuwongella immobilis]VTS02081.1 Protein containing DUF1559 OS=Rhodopirellula baltica SH28 GN=RBSH_02541 PE=4 SV=1: SBP_bac_10 [Tuwongella immobilis]
MNRWVAVVVVGGLSLLAVGILLPAVVQMRLTSDRVRCQDHLRDLASFGMWHATLPGQPLTPQPKRELPPGTVPNPNLPIAERLSWYVLLLPALEGNRLVSKQLGNVPDASVAWDAPANRKWSHTRLSVALCPGAVPDMPKETPALSSYIANAGIGVEIGSADLPATGKIPPEFGPMRANQPTPIDAILDGTSATILLAETTRERGPWIQGGISTLRGLNPEEIPYLGLNRPYAGSHLGGGNFAFVDGSVRFLSQAITPSILRAMLTIAGQEDFDLERP